MRLRLLGSAVLAMAFSAAITSISCGKGDDGVAPSPNDDGGVDAGDVAPGDADPDADSSEGSPDGDVAADCSCARDVSGTRLKRVHRVLTGSDGSRSREHNGWYDTVRAEECAWSTSGTSARCLPVNVTYDVLFSDAACKSGFAVVPKAQCSSDVLPQYGVLPLAPTDACTSKSALGKLGAETPLPATYYAPSFGADGKFTCYPVSRSFPPETKFRTISSIVADTELAGGTVAHQPVPECSCGDLHNGTRLTAVADVITGSDGSKQFTFLNVFRDEKLKRECQYIGYESGPWPCIPVDVYDAQLVYTDAACTAKIVMYTPNACLASSKTEPTLAIGETVRLTCKAPQPLIYAVGKATTYSGKYYRRNTRPDGKVDCTLQGDAPPVGPTKYYEAGADVPLTDFVVAPHANVDATKGTPSAGSPVECACGDATSGSRLTVSYVIAKGSDGSRLRRANGFTDTLRKESCDVRGATTASAGRCMPFASPYGAVYSDAACEKPVPLGSSAPTCDGSLLKPTYAAIGGSPSTCPEVLQRLASVGAEASPPSSWYEQQSQPDGSYKCGPGVGAFPTGKTYALGAEIPPSEFVEIKVSREVDP